jgi:hypothetical protein
MSRRKPLPPSRSCWMILLLGLALLKTTAAFSQATVAEEKSPPAATADVPYSLDLQAFTIAGLPGLHSFVMVGDADKLVLLAGRTNGLHGFAPSKEAARFPSFPKELANDTVYVADLVHRKLLGKAKVTHLPSPYSNQLQASNPEYLLADGFLYVVGGYGPDPKTGTMVTLPFVTAIDFAPLVQAVTSHKSLDAAFAKAHMASFQHPALAITGGDLAPMGSSVLLLYGQRFDGEYTPGGGQAFQEYSNSVRVFNFQASRNVGGTSGAGDTGGVSLQVSFQGSVPEIVGGMDPENPYHRRDLTARSALDPAGNPRIGIYGGVFKGGRIEGYLHPLYIKPGGTLGIEVTEDTAATQLLSQYNCGALQVWSKAKSAMYSTLFGGISQYYWDDSCGCLKRDPGNLLAQGIDSLPFISSVSTFRVSSAGSEQFLHRGASFPQAGSAPICQSGSKRVKAQFLGTETKLALRTAALWSNGILQLDSIKGKTAVGYLVGGIAAYCPPGGANGSRCYASTQGASCASDQIYEIFLNPSKATPTVLLKEPPPRAAPSP